MPNGRQTSHPSRMATRGNDPRLTEMTERPRARLYDRSCAKNCIFATPWGLREPCPATFGQQCALLGAKTHIILHYIKEGSLKPYWVNTGSSDLIETLALNRGLGLSGNSEELLRGGSIEVPIDSNRKLPFRFGWSWLPSCARRQRLRAAQGVIFHIASTKQRPRDL